MTASDVAQRRGVAFGIAAVIVAASIGSACAQQFSREQDIADLRLGQRVLVDDGTCPAGQIKEVSGTKMTESGVLRAQRCVPRVKR